MPKSQAAESDRNSLAALLKNRPALDALADSIELSHRLAPGGWGLTHRGDEKKLRLNLGPIEVVVATSDRIVVFVDRKRVGALPHGVFVGAAGSYRSVPDSAPAEIPLVKVRATWPLLRDAHVAVLEKAARVRSGYSWKGSHSPEAMDGLRRATRRSLPDPGYLSKAEGNGPDVAGWVVKGVRTRMGDADWARCLKPGAKINWHTTKTLHGLRKGAAVFFFKGSPDSILVGEGHLLGSMSEEGSTFLVGVETLRHWCSPLPQAALRKDHVLRDATFLKRGPAGTFYPLTAAQVRRVQQLARQAWITDELAAEGQADASLMSAIEGKLTQVMRRHRSRERKLRQAKMAEVLRRNGTLRCEVPGCQFDFEAVYGELGRGYIEVHHRGALADRSKPSRTHLEDLAIVCANCHAMIHRGGRSRALDEVRVRTGSPAV